MNKENIKRYKFLLHDIAESVSRNEDSANILFKEENIDIESYVAKGLASISKLTSEKKTIRTKQTSKPISNSRFFFKRVVLAAEIASNLFNEPTFGHVKFQKLFYLSEQICSVQSDDRYTKQAAGPFDRRFMHSIDKEFLRQKWFEVKREKGKFSRYKYTPLENHEKFKQYYERIFHQNSEKISWLINTFRKSKTESVELIATLYYCWKEILVSDDIFSENLLKANFFNWSEEKEKFSEKQIESGITWMKENNLTPTK